MSTEVKTTQDPTRRQQKPSSPSPCVGICVIDEAHDFCSGCGRTPEEITLWPTSSQAQKSVTWRALPSRLARLGLHVFRLPATTEKISKFFELTLMSQAGTWEIGIPDRPLRFDVTSAQDITCQPSCITARNAHGSIIRLHKHEYTRAFGLVDENNANQLSAVAVALARGRAEMERITEPADTHIIASSYPYANFALRRLADGTGRLHAETRLADLDLAVTEQEVAALKSFQFDQAAPGAFGIPRAFSVCAVFHTTDQEWLTRAMMP
ncbi:MAG: DUF1289 domain-containing protein [Pseudomonadota bacterium]